MALCRAIFRWKISPALVNVARANWVTDLLLGEVAENPRNKSWKINLEVSDLLLTAQTQLLVSSAKGELIRCQKPPRMEIPPFSEHFQCCLSSG